MGPLGTVVGMKTDHSTNDGWDYGRTIMLRHPFPIEVVTITINPETESRRYANLVANRGPFREIDTTGRSD